MNSMSIKYARVSSRHDSTLGVSIFSEKHKTQLYTIHTMGSPYTKELITPVVLQLISDLVLNQSKDNMWCYNFCKNTLNIFIRHIWPWCHLTCGSYLLGTEETNKIEFEFTRIQTRDQNNLGRVWLGFHGQICCLEAGIQTKRVKGWHRFWERSRFS
jgi:hypothetical protein